MKALIVSLESFQKGTIPPEVRAYIESCGGKGPLILLDESSKIKTNEPCKETKKSKRTQALLSPTRSLSAYSRTGSLRLTARTDTYSTASPALFLRLKRLRPWACR